MFIYLYENNTVLTYSETKKDSLSNFSYVEISDEAFENIKDKIDNQINDFKLYYNSQVKRFYFNYSFNEAFEKMRLLRNAKLQETDHFYLQDTLDVYSDETRELYKNKRQELRDITENISNYEDILKAVKKIQLAY